MTTPLPPWDNDPLSDTDRRIPQPVLPTTPAATTPPPMPRVPANQRPTGRLQVQTAAPQRPTQPTGTLRPAVPATSGRTAGKARQRNQNPLYLPWWSVLAMLIIVMVAAFALVGIVLFVGSNAPVQEATAIIRIITAQPTLGGQASPLSTNAPIIQLSNTTPSVPLQLAGPTLPVVAFTPTPIPVTVGATVVVTGTEDTQLNVRDNAGTQGTTILFRAVDGTLFRVIGGPQQASGFTWWQIQNPTDATQSGWAVSNYLLAQGNTP